MYLCYLTNSSVCSLFTCLFFSLCSFSSSLWLSRKNMTVKVFFFLSIENSCVVPSHWMVNILLFCFLCRMSLSCPAARHSITMRAKSLVTSSSTRVTSSSCDGKWMRTGTMENWTVATGSYRRAMCSASGRCHKHRHRGKHSMTSRWKTKSRTKTASPLQRYTLLILFMFCLFLTRERKK